jgi:hypothetical protein
MKIFRKHIQLIFYVLLLVISGNIMAQQVCENTRKKVTLNGGIKIDVFKEKDNNRIYFLSAMLQLSEHNGSPEFSYQEYTNPGSVSPDGAILHFLVSWGLTKKQLKELAVYIKEHYGKNAILGGGLFLTPSQSGLTISKQTTIGKILSKSLKSKGNPPTTSGGKMALSFHIKKEEVTVISEAFKKSTKLSGTTIAIDYKYKTYTCGKAISIAKNNTIKLIGNLNLWFL